MDSSIELAGGSGYGLDDIRASLVHLSFDIQVAQDEVYVSLGLLFENITLRALENAVFSVRLPDGANVTLVECEVEKEGGMILGAPEKRLEGRYCVNALTDGPFFRCDIGRIEMERDVVIFMKYNFHPTREDNVIHMSLPLPGKQLLTENAFRHKCGINLESKHPLRVVQVGSSSHKIWSRFIARKARIDVSDSLGQGDVDLEIRTIDTSKYLPPIPSPDNSSFNGLKILRRSLLPQKMPEVPMAIFEEYCKAEDLNRIRECKRFSKYSMTTYSSTRSSGSGASAHSFFLSDSETDSEFDLQEDAEDSFGEDAEHDGVLATDDGFKWFHFEDLSPRTPHEIDPSFESEGQWLSGSHPMRPTTSWLDEDMASAADDEFEDFDSQETKAEKEIYELMDVSRGYCGAALATASIVISKERPKLIEISQRFRRRIPADSSVECRDSVESSSSGADFIHTTPATPPSTPYSGDSPSQALPCSALTGKLLSHLDGQQSDAVIEKLPTPKWLEAATATTRSATSPHLGHHENDDVHALTIFLDTSPSIIQNNPYQYGWV